MDAGPGGGRDYPPKTPPPPRKPVSPPFPDPPRPGAPGRVTTRDRRRVMMAGRRGVNWPLERQEWTPAVAGRRVVGQLRAWGYRPDEEMVAGVVSLLVRTAASNGGTRVSLHLADERPHALVLVLNHCPGMAAPSDQVLRELAALGVTDCGTDTGTDGRRLWALLDL
ncbi:hypothetical protein ACIQ7D_03110 [Streptomyces sp. NPDC096310]|uniref:hypothetical protein n=1 Tax=Streptomyces sp. NPDC096310 TaxID=3366082 RepID=UPI0038274169